MKSVVAPPNVTTRTTPFGAKGTVRRLAEKARLLATVGMTPDEYDLYRFGDSAVDEQRMLAFISKAELWCRLRPALNDSNWAVLLDNKLLFQFHCANLGLPVPKFLGVFDPAWGFDATGGALSTANDLLAWIRRERSLSLVAKPVGGMHGSDVLVIERFEDDGDQLTAITNTGQRLPFDAFFGLISRPPEPVERSGQPATLLSGKLLQERVRQHPFLDEIAPWTTNTFRVVTLVDRTGDVHVHFTTVRLGRDGGMVDNYDQGGLSVVVNPVTGEMGKGSFKADGGSRLTGVHPDSGVRFAGRRVPEWDALLDACRRAARLTPGHRWVGWDVALAPDGPVLIEGNSDWAMTPMQVLLPEGFLTPHVRSQFAGLGFDLPRDSLPPVDLALLWHMAHDPRLRPALVPITLRRGIAFVRDLAGRA